MGSETADINSLDHLTLNDAKDLLRTWRDNSERKSEEIIHMWTVLLERNWTKLGNDKHTVLEQVCTAALDCYQIGVADFCIKQLSKEFPNSMRVKKYYAMRLEAQERYDEALTVLETIIKSDETNSAPRKRRVAILKAQGKYVEAIKELTEYLKLFMADTEAWQELSELYIGEYDYARAAFCVEELILFSPYNHLLHQRYADIKYSQGGYDNMELARAYYCQALKLNPNNLRSLYGLYLASSNLSVSPKSTAQKKKEALKLAEWALGEIKEKYARVKRDESSSLEECLAALQLS